MCLQKSNNSHLIQETFDYIKKLLADEEDAIARELQKKTQPLPKENLPPPPKQEEASKVQRDKVCEDDLQQYRDARLEEMFRLISSPHHLLSDKITLQQVL